MNINDYDLSCCGLVTANRISHPYGYVYKKDGKRGYRPVELKDYIYQFEQIEAHQKRKLRNCAMVVLSETQMQEIAAAEHCGWKQVHEWWNPNSSYQCFIYVKVLSDSLGKEGVLKLKDENNNTRRAYASADDRINRDRYDPYENEKTYEVMPKYSYEEGDL